jgi:hypothetical protein
MHPKVPLGDEAQVEARFSPFGESGNLDAVCAKHLVGSEIILDTPDSTPR